jgi:catechol 2,3-dioxygenase-like lactoylglutathione lyase family enzyme
MATRKQQSSRSNQRSLARTLEFNHAMIYTADMAKARAFYEGALGFKVIDEYPGVYTRLRSPGGKATIALHLLEPGQKTQPSAEGVRLYFEVKELEKFCKSLSEKGVKLDQEPNTMPWGWEHAYLKDPDGHELSLYWAGRKRFMKTAAP